MKSPRLAFVMVSVATLILLVGSVLLQRVIFKAAESESSFYLTPTSFSVRPGATVSLTLRSNFTTPAFVVAGQVAIEYDATELEYVEIVPSGNFITKKIVNNTGELLWAYTPEPSQGLVAHLRFDVAVGTITFKALAESATTITVDPSRTIISAIDPQGISSLYNAVVSTQGSVGQVAATASAGDIAAPAAVELNTDHWQTTIQQITRVETVAYPTVAVVIAQLRYLGRVEVNFGLKANSLTQKTASGRADTNQTIRLNALSPGKQYFYQVQTVSAAGGAGSSSQIKTFTTPLESSEAVSAETSQLIAVSPMASQATDIYAKLRSAAGDAVEARSVVFQVASGEATIMVSDDALPKAHVQTLSKQKQKVVIEAVSGENVIARTSLLFDPTIEQLAEPDQTVSQTLPFNQTVQLMLLVVLVILIGAGLVMVRLLRVH